MNAMHLLPRPRRIDTIDGRPTQADPAHPRITIDPASAPHPQGYHLTIGDHVTIEAHDAAGAFYAQQTLDQIVRQCDGPLPRIAIEDWPDFPRRGVMLDISRDKVPTMATLRRLIDRLARWKINEFQLYTEHTYAYAGHEVVWAEASPITPEEVRELGAYCRERFIDLVPNQNSFGHFERWLAHDRYRDLAECPDGWTDQGGRKREPTVLCPTDPRSVRLLDDLYAQLLPQFSSDRFNVGCDETWELGAGRSADEAARRGVGPVYLDHLLAIYDLVRRRGRAMMFWGDIVMKHPELIEELPGEIIGLCWGYDRGHPFDAEARRFAEAGLRFYVCPGTSSWRSIAGRTQNMIGNIAEAAEAGLAHGAEGLLVTDWGDCGHIQPLPVSAAGFAWTAAMSWCGQANRELDLAGALDRWAFEDRAGVMGRVACDLGEASAACGVTPGNQSALFLAFQHLDVPLAEQPWPHYDIAGLDRTIEAIDAAIEPLDRAAMQRDDAALIEREFRFAAALLGHFARAARAKLEHQADRVSDLPAEARKTLAAQLKPLIDEHRAVWLERNRPGGLEDSAAQLNALLSHYGGQV